MTQKPEDPPKYGKCIKCLSTQMLRGDGRIMDHSLSNGFRRSRCTGSGLKPLLPAPTTEGST